MLRLALVAHLAGACSFAVAAVPGSPPCSRAPAIADTVAAASAAIGAVFVAVEEYRRRDRDHDDDRVPYLGAIVIGMFAGSAALYGASAYHGYGFPADCR